MKSFQYVLVFTSMMLLAASCKKDDSPGNGTGNSVPLWIVPYQGVYSGTYDGDDWGTWYLSVGDTPEIILEAHSEPENQTLTYHGALNQDGSFGFSGLNIVFYGSIIDHCEIKGTWYDSTWNENGTFTGWKEPASVNSSLKQINDENGNKMKTFEYDGEGRHIKTQYYQNNQPNNYGIRNWLPGACTYTYYKSDGSVIYEYKNPYPWNSMGLTEYATYIYYADSYTRYDTCFYEYDQQGYQTKQVRKVTIMYNSVDDMVKGTEIRSYTHENGNLTTIQVDYSVGTVSYTKIYNYFYYPEYPDYRNNQSPYMGKSSKNLVKKMEIIDGDAVNNSTSDYSYDFYDNGLVKSEHIVFTEGSSSYDYHNIHYYK